MSLDMTFNGSIGGTTGLLDWGSDIARMWGLGMQNGLGMADAMRDMRTRSVIEPGMVEAKYLQNELAKEQIQNNYNRVFANNKAWNADFAEGDGVYDPYMNKNLAPVNTNPQQIAQAQQAQQSAAPRSTTNTVVGNGMNNTGYTNTIPQPVSVSIGPASQYGNNGR